MLRLLLQELRFRRNGIIGWGIGLCFFPVIYVGLYPSFADQMAGFQEILDLPIYQAMGITMASFEGYVASTVTNLVPVILCIYAVINGTSTLAGEEDDGRLELIVSLQCSKHPDFPEGVRALLVDKDGSPQWQHGSIDEVPADWVEAHFTAPWGADENPLNDL